MIRDDITIPGSNPEAETFPSGTASLNNFYYYFSGPYFIYQEPLKFVQQVYFGHLNCRSTLPGTGALLRQFRPDDSYSCENM